MSTGTVDISLIIINWNTKQLLVDCINSIKEQTKSTSYEIIVVDNASKDDSVAVVSSLFPEVKIIVNPENYGFSKANNIGINQSSGRYVCLVNSDIIVLDNAIDKLVAHADTNNAIGLIAPLTVDENNEIRENCRKFPNLWNLFCEAVYLYKFFPKSYYLHGRAIPRNHIRKIYRAENLSGCFLMARKEAVDKVGLLDERFYFYGEDIDWCKRFVKNKYDVVYYSRTTSIHLGGGSTASAPVKYQVEMEKANLKYWRKHHIFTSVILYILLNFFQNSLSFTLLTLSSILSNTQRKKNKVKRKGKIGRMKWLLKALICMNNNASLTIRN